MDHPDAMNTSGYQPSSAPAQAQHNSSNFFRPSYGGPQSHQQQQQQQQPHHHHHHHHQQQPQHQQQQHHHHHQQPPQAPQQPPTRISKLVATTPGGETISIEIPAGLQQSWVQAMDMSPLDSVHCDSPGFNNFMMTLSPIMQLSSPQPTMSPREQTQPMSPILEGEEMAFGFMGPGSASADKPLSLISLVEGCSLADEPVSPDDADGGSLLSIALDGSTSNTAQAAAAAGAAAASVGLLGGLGAGVKERGGGVRGQSNKENAFSGGGGGRGGMMPQPHPMARTGAPSVISGHGSGPFTASAGLPGGNRPTTLPFGPTGPRKCNCRKSKCLKLYCECFAGGFYCNDECGCMECNNTKEYEVVRGKAIQAIMSRNPNAFTEKIQYILDAPSLDGDVDGEGGLLLHPTQAAHVRGCHCKKSSCIKKYCECFFAGVYCGENCKCESCKNYEGSEALENSRAAAARGREAAAASSGGGGGGVAVAATGLGGGMKGKAVLEPHMMMNGL